MLNVISPVPRSSAPALTLHGQPGSSLNLEFTAMLKASPNWATLDSLILTNTSQFYFDLTSPLASTRFYRASSAATAPGLDLHFVPAITLTGTIGSSVRIDYINRRDIRLRLPVVLQTTPTPMSTGSTTGRSGVAKRIPLTPVRRFGCSRRSQPRKAWPSLGKSVAGVNYSLERSTNIAVATGFTTIATNIAGRGSATVYADTNTSESPAFYRVLLNN